MCSRPHIFAICIVFFGCSPIRCFHCWFLCVTALQKNKTKNLFLTLDTHQHHCTSNALRTSCHIQTRWIFKWKKIYNTHNCLWHKQNHFYHVYLPPSRLSNCFLNISIICSARTHISHILLWSTAKEKKNGVLITMTA